MNFAYHWAFSNTVRKVYYNLTITGRSITVAFLIGAIELVGYLHDQLRLTDPATGRISRIDPDNADFVIVGLFVVAWACALGYWRVAKVEHPWNYAGSRTSTDRNSPWHPGVRTHTGLDACRWSGGAPDTPLFTGRKDPHTERVCHCVVICRL